MADDDQAETRLDAASTKPDPHQHERPTYSRGESVGRYIVLEPLGVGGMGVVYRAYDPELDRHIALKLVRPFKSDESDRAARLRLVREAKAMAKLAHPNVVGVYDAGTFGDHVFVAMELVEGADLARWLADEPRPWPEVVAVFIDAGRGLAAAHAAGLVHRDFKPANVLVGSDGRTRVGDFGLVRKAGADSEAGEDSLAPLRVSASSIATQAGVVMGTPIYMAPEQHFGLAADTRSDQYAFCVALFQGLYGAVPYWGKSTVELAEAKTQGPPEPPAKTHVPGWIRRVVLRGLSVEPTARFVDMRALIDALEDDPSILRRRVAFVGIAATAAVAAALGYGEIRERDSRVCRDGGGRIAEAWGAPERERVMAAFEGTGAPYAGAAWRTVERLLDVYADEWTEAHASACASAHGGTLADLQMSCLRDRLMQVDALIEVFAAADRKVVEKAVGAVNALPGLAICQDAEALQGPIPLPDDPEARARVASVRDELARARALQSAGKYPRAFDLADPAAIAARELGYRPLEAEALYLRGSLEQRLGQPEAAERSLFDATRAAVAGRESRLEARCWMLLAHVTGSDLARPTEAHRHAELAQGVIDGMGGDPGLLVDLVERRGGIANREGEFAAAAKHFERALALREGLDSTTPSSIALTRSNLAMMLAMQNRYDEAIEHAKAALAESEAAFGSQHPSIALSLNNLGRMLQARNEHEEALESYQRAILIAEQSLGIDHPQVITMLANIGDLLRVMGRHEPARTFLERALYLAEHKLGVDHPQLAMHTDFLGSWFSEQDQHEPALRQFRRSLALREQRWGPTDSRVAGTLMDISEVEVARGQHAAAVRALERATEIYAAIVPPSDSLPKAQFALARALWEARRDRPRALELARAALDRHRTLGHRAAVDEVEGWLDGR